MLEQKQFLANLTFNKVKLMYKKPKSACTTCLFPPNHSHKNIKKLRRNAW